MRVKNLLRQFNSRKISQLMLPPRQPELSLNALPDLVEPVIGWRAWRVWKPVARSVGCPALRSVVLDTQWAPRREIRAEHSFDLGAKCNGLLGLDCSCGIYAFKDAADAFAYMMRARDRLLGMSVDVAIGAVRLWGRVIECERGFKAQFAYPHHIYVPATVSRFVPIIASAFGIAVGIFASAREEQIIIGSSRCAGRPDFQILKLKRSDFPSVEKFEYPIGFYDVEPASDGAVPHLLRLPTLPFPGSEAGKPPNDAYRP